MTDKCCVPTYRASEKNYLKWTKTNNYCTIVFRRKLCEAPPKKIFARIWPCFGLNTDGSRNKWPRVTCKRQLTLIQGATKLQWKRLNEWLGKLLSLWRSSETAPLSLQIQIKLFIILPVLRRSVRRVGEAHLCVIAPGQHSSFRKNVAAVTRRRQPLFANSVYFNLISLLV